MTKQEELDDIKDLAVIEGSLTVALNHVKELITAKKRRLIINQ